MKNITARFLHLIEELRTPYTVLISVGVLVLLSASILEGVHKIENNFNQVVVSAKNSLMIGELVSHIKDAQISHEFYLRTADKRYLEHYDFMKDVQNSTVYLLESNYKNNEAQKVRVEEIKDLLMRENKEMNRMISVLRSAGYAELQPNDTLLDIRARVRSKMESLQDNEGLHLEKMGLSAAKSVHYALLNIYLVVAAIVVSAMLLIRYLRSESQGHTMMNREHSAINSVLRKRISKLEKESLMMKDLMENAPVSMLSMDGHGRVVYANRRMCRMMKYHFEDIEGKEVSMLLDPVSRHKFEKYLYDFSAMSDEERSLTGIQEALARDSEGNNFPLEIVLTYSDLEVPMFMASFRDVRVKKEMEIELSRLKTIMSQDHKEALEALEDDLKNEREKKNLLIN